MTDRKGLVRLSGLALFLSVALAPGIRAAESSDDDRLVQANPFARPDHGPVGGARVASVQTARPASWELNAVMLAGAASHAELDGELVGLGEEIHGYRLIAVEARRIVLEREGVRELVSLDDTMGTDDG